MPDDQLPRFQPSLSQAELQRGYQKISGTVPFGKSDIRTAYKPYGLQLSRKRRGKNDSSLYKEATRAVLKWFRDNEREKDKIRAQNKKTRARNKAARTASVAAPVTFRPAAPAAPAPVATAPRTPVYRPTNTTPAGSGGIKPI